MPLHADVILPSNLDLEAIQLRSGYVLIIPDELKPRNKLIVTADDGVSGAGSRFAHEPDRGTIVAIAPDVDEDTRHGQVVIFRKYTQQIWSLNDVMMFLVHESDLLVVLEEQS